MIKHIKLLVFLLLLGLSSCKEEDNNELVSYPITYTNVPVTESSFKVFTKSGEITNTITANIFINKYGYFLTGMNNYNFEGKVTLTFFSPDSVELSMLDSDNTDTLTVYNKPELIYLEKKDTTLLPFAISMDGRRSFINNIFEYKPLYYEEFAMPLSSGYDMIAKYKKCYYVKRDGENLILPMLDVLYKYDNLSYTFSNAINNVFSREFISDLDTNDTLIIKEYSLKLKK